MLSRSEFEVLSAFAEDPSMSQRDISKKAGIAVGSVNAANKSLVQRGLLENGVMTSEGEKELDACTVQNAVILAAGLSSRFAPISYEKPKGLLKVRNEVLVERQIRQLKEAGIDDITVVVGYKKEHFFYLEDLYGVSIVVNEEYAIRNNNSSLMAVREKLDRTYICSSDDYFIENPFSMYVWKSYYAGQYKEGYTPEWCMKIGPGQRIVDVEIGGSDAWYMVGHAYFDTEFSRKFVALLESEYDLPVTADKLWEQIYVDHIGEFDMVLKKYPEGAIFEFDSLDEVRGFDPYFMQNVDSEVFDNIVRVLGCSKDEIHDVYPLSQGLTNLSCHFAVDSGEYVYRHPGVGTEELIDRRAEVVAQRAAFELGLDRTFVYEDPEKGWKISRYISGARQLDPHDRQQLKKAMEMARRLHGQSLRVDRLFDFYDEALRYEALLGGRRATAEVSGFEDMAKKAERLKGLAYADNALKCLTHNDFFMLNFLIDPEGEMHLIDWEYSGVSDYASDFGTFVVCCELSENEALEALGYYFDREPTREEIRHNFAYVGFAGWCWYVWSLYKESRGECVGEWLYIYYRYAKEYMTKALSLYDADDTARIEKD